MDEEEEEEGTMKKRMGLGRGLPGRFGCFAWWREGRRGFEVVDACKKAPPVLRVQAQERPAVGGMIPLLQSLSLPRLKSFQQGNSLVLEESRRDSRRGSRTSRLVSKRSTLVSRSARWRSSGWVSSDMRERVATDLGRDRASWERSAPTLAKRKVRGRLTSVLLQLLLQHVPPLVAGTARAPNAPPGTRARLVGTLGLALKIAELLVWLFLLADHKKKTSHPF